MSDTAVINPAVPLDEKGVLDRVKREKIGYIRLYFTDILGQLKGMTIPVSNFAEVLQGGQGFDGSSVEGFARIDESDLMAIPDATTYRQIPWLVNGERVAMMICDIQDCNGEPYPGDPRAVLKRNVQVLSEQGMTFNVGPEAEYFYFRDASGTVPLDDAGYFDLGGDDLGVRMRKTTIKYLELMGIPVECGHHEVAPSQQEIDLRYQDALRMADNVQLYRYVVREVARQDGCHATFMPKPIFGQNGSGMHCHMSLFQHDKNLFFQEGAEYHLSETARWFIAGLLAHVREATLVLNQLVNSYKRLVPGYEAPVYLSWGRRNRSSLVRVPAYRSGKEQSTRIELRSPDPAANPYLAFSVMLAAGLEGIKGKLPLCAPIEENIFTMTPDRKAALNIATLPGSLDEAIRLAESSPLVRSALGDHIFDNLIANKRIEWERYRIHVSQQEIETSLSAY